MTIDTFKKRHVEEWVDRISDGQGNARGGAMPWEWTSLIAASGVPEVVVEKKDPRDRKSSPTLNRLVHDYLRKKGYSTTVDAFVSELELHGYMVKLLEKIHQVWQIKTKVA